MVVVLVRFLHEETGLMRLLAVLVLVIGVLAAPVSAAAYCTGGTADTRSSTYLVGDSISVYGKNNLPGSYEVNARARRSVTCLGGLLKARLKHGTPRVVIMALGTNFVSRSAWTLADLRAAVDLFPRSTRVVLVTVWRDPAKYRYAPITMRRYSGYMRHMDARRNVVVADWAAYIDRHRSQTFDGTHPTRAGQIAWASLITDAVGRKI